MQLIKVQQKTLAKIMKQRCPIPALNQSMSYKKMNQSFMNTSTMNDAAKSPMIRSREQIQESAKREYSNDQCIFTAGKARAKTRKSGRILFQS